MILTCWIECQVCPVAVEVAFLRTHHDALELTHVAGGGSYVLHARDNLDELGDESECDLPSEAFVRTVAKVHVSASRTVKFENIGLWCNFGILTSRALRGS